MKNSQSLYLLVAAFGAEVLCAHVVFIFLPLSVIASGGGDSVAANLRSLAYIGPVLFGYFIGKIVDLLDKRYLGCGIALALALMTVFFCNQVSTVITFGKLLASSRDFNRDVCTK
jgi:hypothetical protein